MNEKSKDKAKTTTANSPVEDQRAGSRIAKGELSEQQLEKATGGLKLSEPPDPC